MRDEATKRFASRTAKTRRDQGAERIKTSVLLSRSVDIKIRALSGIRGVDKSTLINSLLEEATRGVVVSLRGPLAEGGGAGEEDMGVEQSA